VGLWAYNRGNMNFNDRFSSKNLGKESPLSFLKFSLYSLSSLSSSSPPGDLLFPFELSYLDTVSLKIKFSFFSTSSSSSTSSSF
jgi:hypothetical protein